ncbi:MAG: hypothetical protein LWW93_04885 [Hyphomicrobiales bacterium]|nr:hypothetical protein [Hyphomicrobiales bacterium]
MSFIDGSSIEITGVGDGMIGRHDYFSYSPRHFFDACTDLSGWGESDDFIGLAVFIGDFFVFVAPPHGSVVTTRTARLRWLLTAAPVLLVTLLVKATATRVLCPFAKIGSTLLRRLAGLQTI